MNYPILFVIFLLYGYFGTRMAKKRGRNEKAWFFLCFFFGLIGLAVLYFLKPLKKEIAVEVTAQETKPKLLWYYLDGENKQIGPVSEGVLKRNLEEVSYIWNETMEAWARPEDVY